MAENNENYPLILFDGVCNLCNSSVQFIIHRDPHKKFRFAPLQGKMAAQLGAKYHVNIGTESSSILLFSEGKIYAKSSAALRIAKRLNGLWPLLYGFIIVPAFIRNAVYDMIANNRYRWFGKQESCMLPTPEKKALFFD